ncbi:hypothetical protein AVEN_110624-1 [Araneus ventricosus]|uniref:Uncharacterized protein n=1 Tax=Araneus ventricosus TaxID=182803 RepID=A0A4Y2AU98_ARAVE|nr:hypothetical protein AVEN_110624-1 [Araneus ventricosus]
MFYANSPGPQNFIVVEGFIVASGITRYGVLFCSESLLYIYKTPLLNAGPSPLYTVELDHKSSTCLSRSRDLKVGRPPPVLDFVEFGTCVPLNIGRVHQIFYCDPKMHVKFAIGSQMSSCWCDVKIWRYEWLTMGILCYMTAGQNFEIRLKIDPL